tara:strand:+ start:943 stop:1086 length:144 start_codon:yes stop_codon:yes gene_type:complete
MADLILFLIVIFGHAMLLYALTRDPVPSEEDPSLPENQSFKQFEKEE